MLGQSNTPKRSNDEHLEGERATGRKAALQRPNRERGIKGVPLPSAKLAYKRRHKQEAEI
jgi:hypothetical protein